MTGTQYMQRCISLARLGAGRVAPNPMVGAVLVHGDTIIGEGWHRQYGEAHAEVNCIRDAVEKGNSELIAASTLYVSLEPCAHHGKTPPCTDLIIRHGIPEVVIGCRDPFPAVNGKGIEKLQEAGIKVQTGVGEKECRKLNKRFFCFQEQQRPYVILKWACTKDGFIAPTGTAAANGARLHISGSYSNRLVHRWRSEEAAILVGTRTALLDNPELTTRFWPGPSPVRLVIDKELSLPATLHLFDRSVKTIVYNTVKEEETENLRFYKISNEKNMVQELLHSLYQLQLQSVMVEGGAGLLQSFIDESAWDEARVIQNTAMLIGEGLPAPELKNAEMISTSVLENDRIEFFTRNAENRVMFYSA